MTRTAFAFVRGFVAFALLGAIVWLLTWVFQAVCWAVGSTPQLHVLSANSSRLAIVTVVAVAAIAGIAWFFFEVLKGGFWSFVLYIIVVIAMVATADWLQGFVFNGTAVANLGAQIVYGIAVLVLGVVSGIVFLLDTYEDEYEGE